MDSLLPCPRGNLCDGQHTAAPNMNHASASNPQGLVLTCSLTGSTCATWTGTNWRAIPAQCSWSSSRGTTTTRARLASPSLREVNLGLLPRTGLLLHPRAVNTRATVALEYHCPDCRRPAAKKCAMEIRRCIRHCRAFRCPASGHRSRMHDEARPAALGQQIIEIELTATSPTTNTTLFTTRVFHVTSRDSINLSSLSNRMSVALRLDEVNLDTVQWLDITIEDPLLAWRQALDGPIAIHGAECVFLRAIGRSEFPARWIIDMADGLQAAATRLLNDPLYDPQYLFDETFPRHRQGSMDEFIAAVYVWSDLPDSVRAASLRAGRTVAGEWQTVLNQIEHRDNV